MRNAPNIIETRNFNSYPTAENLIKLDRLYGDSVTTYDLSCIRPKKKVGENENRQRFAAEIKLDGVHVKKHFPDFQNFHG